MVSSGMNMDCIKCCDTKYTMNSTNTKGTHANIQYITVLSFPREVSFILTFLYHIYNKYNIGNVNSIDNISIAIAY